MDRKSALVLVDVQGAWARDNPQTTRRIIGAVDKKRGSLSVIWVAINYDAPDNLPPVMGTDAGRYVPESPEFRLPVDPSERDWFVTKKSKNALSNPSFAAFLDEKGFERIYIAGFKTRQCVYETAQGSVAAHKRVTLLSDLTSDGKDISPSQNDLDIYIRRGIIVADSWMLGL